MLTIFSLLAMGFALSLSNVFDSDSSENDELDDADLNQAFDDGSTETMPLDHLFETESKPEELNYSNDIFVISESSDDLYELGENDNLFDGGAGDDLVNAGDGSDEIHGSLGDDRLSGEAGDDGLFGGNGSDWLDGGLGQDELYGGNGHDTLIGGSDDSRDALFGGEGDDALYAGGGDWLFGGNGSDTFSLGVEDDIYVGDLDVGEDVIEISYLSSEGTPSLSFQDNSVGVDLIVNGSTIATFDGINSDILANARFVFIAQD
jgi:Ca2+-binding RTX toxin-like protein